MAVGTDCVVLDLEDAVPAADKATARAAAAQWAARRADPSILIRVNGRGTPWFADDCAMARSVGRCIMLPKTASPDDLDAAVAATAAAVELVALIETAEGVLRAAEIARHVRLTRIALGAIDLAADLGVDHRDHEALSLARSGLVFGSRATGLPGPIDSVTVDIDNPGRVHSDTAYASRLGFTGKLCIHPRQISAIHAALTPTAEQTEWARQVLAGAPSDGSAFQHQGAMVDKPVLDRARQLLPPARSD